MNRVYTQYCHCEQCTDLMEQFVHHQTKDDPTNADDQQRSPWTTTQEIERKG